MACSQTSRPNPQHALCPPAKTNTAEEHCRPVTLATLGLESKRVKARTAPLPDHRLPGGVSLWQLTLCPFLVWGWHGLCPCLDERCGVDLHWHSQCHPASGSDTRKLTQNLSWLSLRFIHEASSCEACLAVCLFAHRGPRVSLQLLAVGRSGRPGREPAAAL